MCGEKIILACLLVFLLAMPLSSADDKVVFVPVATKLQPLVSNFTSKVSYAEPAVGELEFSGLSESAVSIAFLGKDSYGNDVKPDAIKDFVITVDSSSVAEYKWSYGFALPDEKFVPRVWVSGESARVLGGKYVVLDEKYLVSFDDVLEYGFMIEARISDDRTAVFILTKDWAADGTKLGDKVLIDPMVTAYPAIDGYLERDRNGVFDVYLTGSTLSAGNNVGVGDADYFYRTYMSFNTTFVEPWDTVINATFYARVSSETCGSGASNIMLQNISDFGELGFLDWDITYQNITIFYNTSTNASGWYSSNVSGWITKNGFTYFRLMGAYENYDGVDCFINLNSNESANELYVEVWVSEGVPDATPPDVQILFPLNDTYYDVLTLSLNVIGNDTNNITEWKYSLNGGANVTFTPNTTFAPQDGSNNIIVWAQDFYGNWGSNITYFTFVNNVPNITIVMPENDTYYNCPVPLEVSASEGINTWIYTLDSDNITFVPNTTVFVPHCGTILLSIYANDSTGLWGYANVTFTVTMMVGGEAIEQLILYYPPFVMLGDNVSIYVTVIANGVPYNASSVEITLDNTTVNMIYNLFSDAYEVIWIPSATGSYNFSVLAMTNMSNVTELGLIEVYDEEFCVNMSIWTNVTMSPESLYKNEFAWIYAVRQLDPSLKVLFGKEKFMCPPQGEEECHWHGEYVNGTAKICFNEPANYTYFIIGNNILWEDVIGSGFPVSCDFCEPDIVKQTMLYGLGTYYHESSESIDLYINPTELSLGGGSLGLLTSGLWWLFMGIISLVFFVVVLIATGSLKAALAALILLPLIITLFISVVTYM